MSGYMCAFLENGFAVPLTAQATVELQVSLFLGNYHFITLTSMLHVSVTQELLPNVFCDHKIGQAWGNSSILVFIVKFNRLTFI